MFEEPLELEDKTWFPAFLRKMQTEYIGWLVSTVRFYDPIVPILAKAAAKKNFNVTDLCSGSGQPWIYLAKHSEFEHTHISLSDKFPQTPAVLPVNCNYVLSSIDAVHGPFPENSLVTFFNSFHHFTADEKDRIIHSLIEKNNSIFIAEILKPGFGTYVKIFLTTSILQVLLAPFVKPFRLSRLFFTWILPINILTVTFDGMASIHRCGYLNNIKALWKNIPMDKKPIFGETSSIFGKVYYVHIP